MTKLRHSEEFKEQALGKARARGSQTLSELAAQLNLPLGTLKGWLKTTNANTLNTSGSQALMAKQLPLDRSIEQWSAAQRMLALHESHGLHGQALHAWCREKGLFEHQLESWRQAFCAATQPESAQDARATMAELKALQGKHEGLQRELRRKERALAEAAALLVLQKKFQQLLGGED